MSWWVFSNTDGLSRWVSSYPHCLMTVPVITSPDPPSPPGLADIPMSCCGLEVSSVIYGQLILWFWVIYACFGCYSLNWQKIQVAILLCKELLYVSRKDSVHYIEIEKLITVCLFCWIPSPRESRHVCPCSLGSLGGGGLLWPEAFPYYLPVSLILSSSLRDMQGPNTNVSSVCNYPQCPMLSGRMSWIDVFLAICRSSIPVLSHPSLSPSFPPSLPSPQLFFERIKCVDISVCLCLINV